MNLAGIDWGDAPTWCGVVAASVAGVFAVRSFGKLKEQVEDQRQALAEQRAFIADQRTLMTDQVATMAAERAELSAVADARKSEQARQMRLAVQPGSGTTIADVMNNSGGPVRDVAVKFGAYHANHAIEVHPAQPYQTRGQQRTSPVDLVGPGRRFHFVSSALSETTLANSRPMLTFKDSAGVGWSLDENGELLCTDEV
ncbi:hypothetical protein F4556_005200 [Kitasatospora gansuensis]|uniref:Uncharacterized protein n=1 Tax=Kitasatospora gansuensis TaxID=258050 RepID=A0A7W7WK57_9ACTN|nr:hypothetical protein [Kitasatospora gansuensis]MBB4949665.1 hypothetical protein [Kitasatospora gansuensis]